MKTAILSGGSLSIGLYLLGFGVLQTVEAYAVAGSKK